MSFYTIHDQRLRVWEEGPRDAPVALLIHGWSSSSFTWLPLMPMMQTRYRCLAIDLPGFGRSPAPSSAPTIAGYADLAAQVIENFSDRPVLVLGHSMGGQIAATLALRHAEHVDQLVLLNPALSGRLSTRVNMLLAPHVLAERYRPLEWLMHLVAQTPLDYTDFLLRPTSFAERTHVNEADYQRIRQDARRQGQGKVRAACFNAMREGDLRGKLQQIQPPALVLWGAEDNIVPLRDAGAVADEWPRADLRLLPNAGHWPQFEQPEATRRLIAQFLGLPPKLPNENVENDLDDIQANAQFLNNCELGSMLSPAQRLRLASIVHAHSYEPGEQIARADTIGDEMYMIREGSLEIWLRPNSKIGRYVTPTRLATAQRGEVVGELALLDNAPRSADVVAGANGATLLTLNQSALNALSEDDPAMGMRMMQNLAVSLGRRLRNQNWRAARAETEAISS